MIRCTVGEIVAFQRKVCDLAETVVDVDLLTAVDVAIRDLTEIVATDDLALARGRAVECLAILVTAFNSAKG